MYEPKIAPPELESNPVLLAYIRDELVRIMQEFGAQKPLLSLSMVYKLPDKYRDGTIILMADSLASSLGLASGPGYYGYRAGAWRFLG